MIRNLALGSLSLLIVVGTGPAVSAAFASFATESSAATAVSSGPTDHHRIAQNSPNPKPNFTQLMEVGYAAAEQGDYQTALINFRRALAARPGNTYALRAIENMETYIAQQRAEAAKQAEIARLQQVVAEAVEQQDWACAMASVEQMIPLVGPNSSERARLLAYQGELSGFIESRANLEQWSTVCPG